MQKITNAKVYMGGNWVGTLALYENVVAFEYSKEWLANGFSISPFSLPLEKRVFMPKPHPFDGLFGVFSDSLPDGWGRLLLDRMLRNNGEDPGALTPIERLCIVGSTGMGALEYVPEVQLSSATALTNFDELARECAKVLEEKDTDDLDKLFKMGGSSGGARPKVFTTIDGRPWIVKFRSSIDDKNAGKMEYDYAQCAAACSLDVPQVALLSSNECAGYFAVERFDRVQSANGALERIHMASASALLETSHRLPNLDYAQLMKLVSIITHNNMNELKKMYRLMCFNAFAHNRDDHSKNFTFLYNQANNEWVLSPAYDLTYSNSLGGQHATTVAGNGENPGIEDILQVARGTDLDASWAHDEAKRIQSIVQEQLGEYLTR